MDPDWRHLPSLSSLRAFDATARSGSFAGAATRLNVTPAAVAQQVRALEADLNLRLTEREGRGIRLTSAGSRLAAALAQGFERIAQGVQAAAERESARGIRVSATPGMASKVILPRLSHFWERHPDIPVSIMPDRRSVDLTAEGFDLAIRAVEGEASWPGTESRVLLDCDYVAVAAPSLAGPGPVDPAKLPWLTHDPFERGLLSQSGLDVETLEFRDIGPPTMEPAAARMGYGVMVCPEIMVRADLASGELCRLPIRIRGRMAYHAVTPRGMRRPQVTVFVDWLERALMDSLEGQIT